MDYTQYAKLINEASFDVDSFKYELAQLIYKAQVSVNWKETEFKSFTNFCRNELKISVSTAYNYANTYALIVKYNYSSNEVYSFTREIGWSRMVLGLQVLHRRLLPKSFIRRFRDLNLNQRVKSRNADSSLTHFSFHLPADQADVLTSELMKRGMRMDNHNRINASHAMSKLVSEVFNG